MMDRIKVPVTLAIIALFCLTSCDVVMGTVVAEDTATPTIDNQVLIDQAVAATMAVQTQIALAVQQTLAAAITDTPQVTDTPQFTNTPSLTPTITPSITPENPLVTVSMDTRCRTGPGTVYDVLGVLLIGQTAEVVGRSHNSDNWIIKLPDTPSVTCWLWAYYSTITGDTSGVPVVQPPPTPTPVTPY
jgi:hypothetical protein